MGMKREKAFLTLDPDVVFIKCMSREYHNFVELKLVPTRHPLDYDKFNELLREKPFVKYSEILEWYQNAWISHHIDGTNSINEVYMKDEVQKNKLAKKLIPFLISLMEGAKSKNGISISVTGYKDARYRINDKNITQAFIDSVIDVFKKNKLNSTSLTKEEAKEYIKNPDLKSNIILICKGLGISYESLNYNELPEQLITNTSQGFSKEREVTLDFLKIKMDEVEVMNKIFKRKRGAKYKNRFLAPLVLDLSYLLRLEEFIFQDKCKHIYDFRLKNSDSEWILKYLEIWGLLGNRKTTSGYMYISTLINSYKRKRGVYDRINNSEVNEVAIDYLRLNIRNWPK